MDLLKVPFKNTNDTKAYNLISFLILQINAKRCHLREAFEESQRPYQLSMSIGIADRFSSARSSVGHRYTSRLQPLPCPVSGFEARDAISPSEDVLRKNLPAAASLPAGDTPGRSSTQTGTSPTHFGSRCVKTAH